MIKINWDTALDHQKGVVGLGIIARDEGGRFLSAYGMTKRAVVSPTNAEALAALHAIIFAKERVYGGYF